jgi:hypothetical protein
MPRHRRTPSLALCAALAAGFLVAAPANGAPGRPGPGGGTIELAATPAALDLIPLPCHPGSLLATLTNTGRTSQFADMTLSADEPLALSREIFSTYLPAADPDQPVSAPVGISAPRDTAPGTYEIELRQGRQRLTVPVHVQPAPPKGPGDNLALGEEAFASSAHGNFDVCGAVDGNRDSADWDVRTGWNDGTPAVFPDTYGVHLPEARQITEVQVQTLDSARYSAAGYGLRDWDVQVRADGRWTTVAEVRDSTAGLVTSRFDPVAADAVQLVIHGTNDARYSRIVELEVR